MILGQRRNGAICKPMRCGVGLKGNGRSRFGASESFVRSRPDCSVVHLGDRKNGVGGQTAIDSKMLDAVRRTASKTAKTGGRCEPRVTVSIHRDVANVIVRQARQCSAGHPIEAFFGADPEIAVL